MLTFSNKAIVLYIVPLAFGKAILCVCVCYCSDTKMGKARIYRCSLCPTTNYKYRLEAHFYKHHVALSDCPYFCSLCLFRCLKEKELHRHVQGYNRHKELAKGFEDPAWLKASDTPYLLQPGDIVPLSKEETDVWHSHHTKAKEQPDMEQVATAAGLDEYLATLDAGVWGSCVTSD